MNLFEKELIERRKAMVQVPALIKAYLKLGGCVGDGAYIDHAFNTIDICLVVDVAKMNTRQKSLYSKQFASET